LNKKSNSTFEKYKQNPVSFLEKYAAEDYYFIKPKGVEWKNSKHSISFCLKISGNDFKKKESLVHLHAA
jgi:hypothetical protein